MFHSSGLQIRGRVSVGAGTVSRLRISALALAVLASLAVAAASPREAAIAGSYCDVNVYHGDRCYEGSGYRGWRYHENDLQSHYVPGVCVNAYTGTNYRTGSGCFRGSFPGSIVDFYSFGYCSAEPTANSSVTWQNDGDSGTYGNYKVNHGYVDSRTSYC